MTGYVGVVRVKYVEVVRVKCTEGEGLGKSFPSKFSSFPPNSRAIHKFSKNDNFVYIHVALGLQE